MAQWSFQHQIYYNLVVLTLLPCLIENPMAIFGFSQKEYSVVIDAGSSSTKLLVAVFEKKSGRLSLDSHEPYEKFTPALTDLIEDPKGIKDQIEKILKRATKLIPNKKLDDTPVIFRATAGFRLLGEEKRTFMLEEVKKVLEASRFKMTPICSSILSESDEGLYGWIAANLLLDRLHDSPDDMVATLDLGGASTQITFPLTTPQFTQFPLQVRWIPVSGKRVNYYTHSFMGLGMGAATVAILSQGKMEQGNVYDTPCTSFRDNGKVYHYNGQSYTVHRMSVRPEDTEVDVEHCTNLVQNYIKSFNIRSYNPLSDYDIHAFAGFFYVLRDSGLIDAKSGGRIAVSQIQDKANEVCRRKEPQKDPFLCLHLIYIYTLLTEGYKLQPSKEIFVNGELNGHRINWALGFAHYTQNIRYHKYFPFDCTESQTEACERFLE